MADEQKHLDEMASTMDAAALEEMRDELEKAGYKIDASNIFSPWEETVQISAPDGWIQYFSEDGGNHWTETDIVKRRLDKKAIEVAYAHLQQQHHFAEFEQLVSRLAKAKADVLGDDDGHPIWDTDFEGFIKEAKALLGKE